jgi:hypothetical protein
MISIRKTVKRLALLMVIGLPWMAFSQSVTVQASIDSSTLSIGQQSLLHITLTGPSTHTYKLPSFNGDTVVAGIEVIKRERVDTAKLDNGYIRYKADYVITSFDEGLYYIPPIPVSYGSDTTYSDEMALKVISFNVDTANYTLFDIKPVQKAPFVLYDYLLPFQLLFLLIGLLYLVWWINRRRKLRRNKVEEVDPFTLLPPHVAAIMELDKLKSEKPWVTGRNKEYYTRLSEVVRKYIQRRFLIDAPEMTTSEILELFYRDKDTMSVYQNLKQILSLSDLVKFAKLVPIENENELSLMNAYLFVNQTKVEEVKPMEEQTESEQESKKPDAEPTEKVDQPDEYVKKYQPK